MRGCYSMHVEVRGQLLGTGSPSYHMDTEDRIKILRVAQQVPLTTETA